MKVRSGSPLLSDLAYERILEALLDSRLPMGEKISQAHLTKITGVPVGPVRDALKVLEADSVVRVHPRSGIAFVHPSTDLVRATYQFRAIIERAATRNFARTAPESKLNAMLQQHEAVEKQIRSQDANTNVVKLQSDVEDLFHPIIVSSLKNELVEASYRRLQLMARIIKVEKHIYPHIAQVSIAEHKKVLLACLSRDEQAAETAIADHLSNALVRNLGLN